MRGNNWFKLNTCLAICLAAAGMVKAQSYVPEYNDARLKVKPLVPIKAYSFDLKDVMLLVGLFFFVLFVVVLYLLTIEPDRLLSAFRTHSGLQARGKMYEGWESSGLAGHTLGHYLSAISMHYASSRNPEFLKRANYIVKVLDECQE